MKGKSLFKLISSIASLACVLLLCIVVVYAWYTSNKNVSTSGIQAESDSKDFTVVLQQLNTETKEFGPTLEMNDMNPGDIRYFKLTITNMVGKDSNFYARFEGISSTIDETEIFAKPGYVYTKYTLNNTVNELKLYDISSNRVVSNGKILYLDQFFCAFQRFFNIAAEILFSGHFHKAGFIQCIHRLFIYMREDYRNVVFFTFFP